MPVLRGKDYGKMKMSYPHCTKTKSGLRYKVLALPFDDPCKVHKRSDLLDLQFSWGITGLAGWIWPIPKEGRDISGEQQASHLNWIRAHFVCMFFSFICWGVQPRYWLGFVNAHQIDWDGYTNCFYNTIFVNTAKLYIGKLCLYPIKTLKNILSVTILELTLSTIKTTSSLELG